MTDERYEQIHARTTDIIEHYRDDLEKHDKRFIAEVDASTAMLHFARTCGTHIYALHNGCSDVFPAKGDRCPYMFGTTDRDGLLDGLVDGLEYCIHQSEVNSECKLISYWNGRSWQTIDAGRARQIVADWKRRVRIQWKRANRLSA